MERSRPDHGPTTTQRRSLLEQMRSSSRRAVGGILLVVSIYALLLFLGAVPGSQLVETAHEEPQTAHSLPFVPPLWAVTPFVLLLLTIAVFPLLSQTRDWWHHNRNRFLVAVVLGGSTLLYYGLLHPGGLENHFAHLASSAAGWETLWSAFSNGIFSEFIPFIVLLFSLYVISGGINLSGDLPAHPATNTAFIALGTILASFIGTTGAAMVLIRPLILTNIEREYKVHTILFFIFCACNCGGLLLPIGDPPLFLGYLRGVPFLWTTVLWPYWLLVNSILLAVYFAWDWIVYRKEALRDLMRDEQQVQPLRLHGAINLLWLLGVVLSVAFILPGQPFLNTGFHPPVYFRETAMLLFVILSLLSTHANIRMRNRFDYVAITEVAALFSGIFVCMQVPIEILHVRGPQLGIDTPFEFFWFTGVLSSVLDNAPTYVVFFETAASLPTMEGFSVLPLPEGEFIMEHLLAAISLGAVFMGALTYIGNGPNFMVKSIAEQSGIRMPSFFGYMGYSLLILIPIFVLVLFLLSL